MQTYMSSMNRVHVCKVNYFVLYTVDSSYKEPCYKELLLIKNNLPVQVCVHAFFLCYNEQTPGPVVKNLSMLPVTFKWDLKWILCS